MINNDGWQRFNIWEHSETVRDLYRRRCLREVEEMTAHAQAAELLASRVNSGDAVLDTGCGSGYFFIPSPAGAFLCTTSGSTLRKA